LKNNATKNLTQSPKNYKNQHRYHSIQTLLRYIFQ